MEVRVREEKEKGKKSTIEKIWNLPPQPVHTSFQGQYALYVARTICQVAGLVHSYALFSLFFSEIELEILAKNMNRHAPFHDTGIRTSYHPFVCKWHLTTPRESSDFLAIVVLLRLWKGASPKTLWKKLEPLNTNIWTRAKDCFVHSQNVWVDEMMICFLVCSVYTIKIPNKPIWLGYKVLAVCDTGNIYN